jgi:hypothetical protein
LSGSNNIVELEVRNFAGFNYDPQGQHTSVLNWRQPYVAHDFKGAELSRQWKIDGLSQYIEGYNGISFDERHIMAVARYRDIVDG